MIIKFVRKLEVVHNEVEGYLTRCALPRRSLILIIMSRSVTQSVRYVGIELLGQLKNLQHNFPKMRGGDGGRLEFFRKFRIFGSAFGADNKTQHFLVVIYCIGYDHGIPLTNSF